MAKACVFCHFLNSYICDGSNEDCIGCGRCHGVCTSKEDRENA